MLKSVVLLTEAGIVDNRVVATWEILVIAEALQVWVTVLKTVVPFFVEAGRVRV